MMRVLYISFYFPPVGAIASLRAAKMVKYLARQGYEINVLCASRQLMKAPKDATSGKDIPSPVSVFRAIYPDPAWLYKLLYGLRLTKLVRWLDRQVLFPGSESLWLPFAKKKLDLLLRSGLKPDLAVVSFGPPAVLKLALYLKHRHQLPYILDWRDEWTNNPELTNSPHFVRASVRELELEKSVLRNADGCVYLTSQMRDNFLARYLFLKDIPYALIPNGYDEDDFIAVATDSHVSSVIPVKTGTNPTRQTLRIHYSGSFYDRRQPDPLWKALLELIHEHKIPSDAISFIIRGNNRPAFVLGRFQSDPVLKAIVKLLPYQPHRSNLREMLAADALLLYVPSGQNTDSVLTGKIFEYLRVSKPVLAIVPDQGAAAAILREAGIGFIASDTDHKGVKAQIVKLFECWQSGAAKLMKTRPTVLAQYSRSAQALSMAKLIDSISPGLPSQSSPPRMNPSTLGKHIETDE